MTLLGIIAVLATSGWIIFTTFRRFVRRPYPLSWRVGSVVLSLGGLALGGWLLTREYLVSPTVRLAGFPFAVGGYEFIGGQWHGGLVSRFVLLAFIADLAVALGICLLPLRVAQFISERRVKNENTPETA